MGEGRVAWERANKAWIEEYFVLIQATFASFWEKGEWPEERALTRKFAQTSGPRIDVTRAVQAQPPGLGLAAHVTFRHVSLGVRHLLGVREARPTLNLLVAIGSRAAEIYKTTEDETKLYVADPAIARFFSSLEIDDPDLQALYLQRVAKLVAGDYPTPIQGAIAGSPPFFTIEEGVVAEFDDVGSPEDYLRRQVEILERRKEEAERSRAELEPELRQLGPTDDAAFGDLGFFGVTDDVATAGPSRSNDEDQILAALEEQVPEAAPCYEQALRDLADDHRVSYRGTANELRSAVWEVLERLAPDERVSAAQGFTLEKDQQTPTRKQKARFILRGRLGGTACQTPEASLELIELQVANLTAGLYNRSSSSSHIEAEQGEIRQIKMYVDAFLAEVLQVHRS